MSSDFDRKKSNKPKNLPQKLYRESGRIIEQIRRNYWRFMTGFKYRSSISKGLRRLALDPRTVNGVFHILIREEGDKKTVVKIPRLDSTPASKKLFKLLTSERGESLYREHLKKLNSDKHLGPHLPQLIEFGQLGGYESEYVNGPNLAELRAHLYDYLKPPAGIEPLSVISAISTLVRDIDLYAESGGTPCGDWALHNLVYDTESSVVKNVDLEGFFTYDEIAVESTAQYAREQLAGLSILLKLADSGREEDIQVLAAQSAVWNSTSSGSSYSGIRHISGYHSITVRGNYFRGQRECGERLAKVPYDFTGKNVLDVGCNAGGMLHALADKISFGTGIDYDSKCVNAANLVAKVNGTGKLNFFTFNLENDDLNLIRSLTLGRKIDICFLLSVCMWIKNWRQVLSFLASISDNMLFESNGKKAQQDEQIEYVRKHYRQVTLIQEGSPDDPGQKGRSLYLCVGSISAN